MQPPTTLCAGNAAAVKGSLANAAKCLLSTDEGASANSEQNVQCIESICARGSFVLALEACVHPGVPEGQVLAVHLDGAV